MFGEPPPIVSRVYDPVRSALENYSDAIGLNNYTITYSGAGQHLHCNFTVTALDVKFADGFEIKDEKRKIHSITIEYKNDFIFISGDGVQITCFKHYDEYNTLINLKDILHTYLLNKDDITAQEIIT